MKALIFRAVVGGLAMALAMQANALDAKAAADANATWADNPFAQPSVLPFHLPPFDRIADAHYLPAFETGMAEQRRDVEAIDRNPEPPSFTNTIVALERSGRVLERVSKVFFNLNQANSSDATLKIETDMAPKLAAHEDAILLDSALFARVDAVYRQRSTLPEGSEARQLLERYYTRFVRAGARLSASDQAKLRLINEQLATLSTAFRQTVLKATADAAIVFDRAEELDGLSSEELGAAAEAAAARGNKGKWLVTIQNTTIQPLLAQLKNRAQRERIHRASIARGNGGVDDNRTVIARMIKLRAERAQLLGYPTHAAYVLADENAGTPQAVNKMLKQIARAGADRAKREAATIQKLIDAQAKAAHAKTFTLQPWDWAFYAEQVRKAQYDFDEAEVKPYFELDRVLNDGVFYAANQLFGLTFKERKDLPAYRPDVRVFEVFDSDGTSLALFLADFFSRDNKQGGAWMDSFVDQSTLLGYKPVIVNNLNIRKPAAGQPVLMTFDEVTTMFHEFGHALHGMLSNVEYPMLSGTQVPHDFVEYPSQYNEMWAREPAVMAHFAKHYQTGEAMPKALFDKVLAAQQFDQGYATTEYIEAAMLDQSWHQIGPEQAPTADQVMAFEAAALSKNGVALAAVPPRYHTPYFLHIFADDYSAGYYAYIWSEVLARATGSWFHSHGGMTRANGDFLRAKVLSRGHTRNTKELFEEFYGGAPDAGPLLEYRGLAEPKHKP
jgi:peptidyl-dipeptidase Dcp